MVVLFAEDFLVTRYALRAGKAQMATGYKSSAASTGFNLARIVKQLNIKARVPIIDNGINMEMLPIRAVGPDEMYKVMIK